VQKFTLKVNYKLTSGKVKTVKIVIKLKSLLIQPYQGGQQQPGGYQNAPQQAAPAQSWGNAPQQPPAQQAAPRMAPAYQPQQAPQPSQPAPQQAPAPQRPAPQAQPKQEPAAFNEPSMDFDDDIPF